jgi:hypothetical protein
MLYRTKPPFMRSCDRPGRAMNKKSLPFYATDVAEEIISGWLHHLDTNAPFASETAAEIAEALNGFYGLELMPYHISELVASGPNYLPLRQEFPPAAQTTEGAIAKAATPELLDRRVPLLRQGKRWRSPETAYLR